MSAARRASATAGAGVSLRAMTSALAATAFTAVATLISHSPPPNIVLFLIDDMDLERIPFYPRLDDGAAWQLRVHESGGGCRAGANCTYSAPHIEAIGRRGARFLGAHVPVSVCTPSRYSLLTGRLPSSSPFYSATKMGHLDPQVDISWNTWVEQGARDEWLPCCGPGVHGPCAPARMWGCTRRAKTLGSMLQGAGYYTGFVGKWHLSPPPPELIAFHKGAHGAFPYVVNEETAAAAADLQARYHAVREASLVPRVRSAGFNYTGALSVGNVVDLSGLGLAVHNMDWEAGAGVSFLREAGARVASGHAPAFYLHMCTTLTHSPGPSKGICADPRLSEGGLLPSAPSVLPPRASTIARTGGGACVGNKWQEYDASHTLWVDDGVGALLTELRRQDAEEDTLFIVLADHQRVGKGSLYHGLRTPMVLQFPSRVPPAQTLPTGALVSSLDIVPTVLDAAGLLGSGAGGDHAGGRAGESGGSALPYNAGARLDGRSLMPLLRGGLGFEPTAAGHLNDETAAQHGIVGPAASVLASAQVPTWWRDVLWAELGVAATVKHRSGWQFIALHMPGKLVVTDDRGERGLASEMIACEWERLRTGTSWTATYTHARHCAWRATNHTLTFNLIGESRDRFDSNDRYRNFHKVEQVCVCPNDTQTHRVCCLLVSVPYSARQSAARFREGVRGCMCERDCTHNDVLISLYCVRLLCDVVLHRVRGSCSTCRPTHPCNTI